MIRERETRLPFITDRRGRRGFRSRQGRFVSGVAIEGGLTASSDKSSNVAAIHNMVDLSYFLGRSGEARLAEMLRQRRHLQWQSQKRSGFFEHQAHGA